MLEINNDGSIIGAKIQQFDQVHEISFNINIISKKINNKIYGHAKNDTPKFMTMYDLTKNDTPKFIFYLRKGTPKNGTSRTSIYGSYPPGNHPIV